MKATSNWLDTWARFRPEAEALFDVGTGRRWTYAALQQESRAWARRLAAEGVRPGDRVAVLAQNRAETFALLFAVADLGAVLFPMNGRLSEPELRWQLEDCTPAALVVDGASAGRLAAPALSMDEGPGLPLREDPGDDLPGSALDAPWQLMYTSGSTGRPKGALLSHGQVHWNALNTILACDLGPDSSTLMFMPLFHTGGLNCLSTPLLHRGGRVVVAPSFDAGAALRLIAEERLSHLIGVPTIYRMIADAPGFAEADLSSVKDALCGGAALPVSLLERYLSRGIPLRQGFGLTEVGPNCFSMPPSAVRRKLGSVGQPIHHIAMRLLRPDGSEAAVDEPGELVLGGPVVFNGYWGRPEDHSLRDGWFHTGDLLSRDAEGFYFVRGRIKEMFISGGENVYPAEVEAAIGELPGVALVAVVGVPDPRWGEVGAAFVEPAPGETLDPGALAAGLSGRLARFKIPKVFKVMTLPRTASGKIDKPALSRLAAEAAPAG